MRAHKRLYNAKMPSKTDYEKFFTEADADGSGSLSFGELVTVLRKHGYRGTDAELKVRVPVQ